MITLTCSKSKKVIHIQAGTELLKVFENHPELLLRFGCRQGDCGVCAVKIVEGAEKLSRCSRQEKKTLQRIGLPEDHRLGCQCALIGDVTIEA